jgi:hypothetical protein
MKISDVHLSYQGPATPAPPATEEEARLAAFFNETSNEWEQTHEALSQLVFCSPLIVSLLSSSYCIGWVYCGTEIIFSVVIQSR